MGLGSGLLVLLLGTGLFLSIRTHFFQIFGIRTIFRQTFGRLFRREDGAEQWKTCSAALAAAMGTGNIVGVAAAISAGGAGAVFWMWVSAFLGMMLTYAENVLAVRYRSETEKRAVGALAYLKNGLRSPVLAGLYAVFCVLASFGMGNMTQSSAAAAALEHGCHIPPIWTGVGVTILLLGTVLGGMRTIGTVTQFLMPILSGGYLLAAVIVLVQHAGQLGTAFATIFHAAWHPAAVGGGTLGTVLSAGLRHGVFSNEAGLGSSAMIHSHAVDAVHGQQGMWSMVEVFVDTMLCCTVTALVLLCTGNSWNRWYLWDCSSLFQCVWCWSRASTFLDDCPVCFGNAAWLVLLRRSCRSIFRRRTGRSLVSLGILLCRWIGSSGNAVNHLDILRPCKWIDGDSELIGHLVVIP